MDSLKRLLPFMLIAGVGYFVVQGLGQQRPAAPPAEPGTQPRTPTLAEEYEGRYIYVPGVQTIFKVERGARRGFGNWESFLADGGQGDRSNVWPLSQQQMLSIPLGPAMPNRVFFPWRFEGAFIKTRWDRKIYIMQSGFRHWIPDWETFQAIGGRTNLSNVSTIADADMAAIPEGAPIASVLPPTVRISRAL